MFTQLIIRFITMKINLVILLTINFLYIISVVVAVLPSQTYSICADWTAWEACQVDGASSDHCTGVRERERSCDVYDIDENATTTAAPAVVVEKENGPCPLNVDGGFTAWTTWATCSVTCDKGTTTRRRRCRNPSPCHNGTTCVGSRSEQKTCFEPVVDGQWTAWSNYSVCNVPMGEGTQTRYRQCTNPPVCGGMDCDGPSNETQACKVVPSCFSANDLFDPAYQQLSSPLQIYSTVKIDIGSNLQIFCQVSVRYNWELYSVNVSNVYETGILYSSAMKSLFTFNPGEIPLGLYRLDFNASYVQDPGKWVYGYMLVEIQYPPPNSKISGGSGRMIGSGYMQLDALTESYDLVLGPGQNDALDFSWRCFRLFTTYLYDLLKVMILPEYLFPDPVFDWFVWHNNTVLPLMESVSKWNKQQTFISMLERYVNSTEICFGNYTIGAIPSFNNESLVNETSLNNSTAHWTNYEDQVAHSDLLYIMNIFFTDDIFETSLKKFTDSLTSKIYFYTPVIEHYKGTTSMPKWANDLINFKAELEYLNQTLADVNKYYNLLSNTHQSSGTTTSVDGNLIVTCHGLTPTNSYYRYSKTISSINDFIGQNFNWTHLYINDQYFTQKTKEFYSSDLCSNFTEVSRGYAQVYTSVEDMNTGTGYIIIVGVSANNSFSYYTQRLQVTDINPIDIDFDCRMNCMEKMASTSKMSLRAECPSCTYRELVDAEFTWNIKEFDSFTGTTTDIPNWERWLLSDPKSAKFVLEQNSLQQQSQYIIEVNMTLPTSRRTSLSFVILSTDIIPYGGSCKIKDRGGRSFFVGEIITVECKNWKDEGFRSSINSAVDWKEPLNYRVLIRSGRDAKLLYFGVNRIIEGVQFVQGDEDNNYRAELILQIFDVFNDYSEVIIPLMVSPPYSSIEGVDSYLQESYTTIHNTMSGGDTKRVLMTVESGASVVTAVEFAQPLLSDDSSSWASMGVYTDSNGDTTTYTFEELWGDYEQPENETQKALSVMLGNYSEVLQTSIYDTKEADIKDLKQLAQTYGTTLSNTDLVSPDLIAPSFGGNDHLITLLMNYSQEHPYTRFEDYELTSEAIIKLMDNAITGLFPTISPDFPSNVDVYSIFDDIAINELFLDSGQTSVGTLTTMEKAYLATETARRKSEEINNTLSAIESNVPIIFTSIDNLGSVLSRMFYQKQLPILVEQGGVKTSMEKLLLPELINKRINRTGLSLQLYPKAEEGDISENEIQITQFSKTPFSWNSESKYITSETVSVKVQNGSKIPKTMPVKLHFPNSAEGSRKSMSLAVTDDVNSQVITLKFYWKNVNDDLIFSVNTNDTGYTHKVYLKKDEPPTGTKHDWTVTIEKGSWIGSGFNVIVPGRTFSSPGVAYISVQVIVTDSHQSSRRKKRSTTNTTSTTNILNYSVVTYTVGCRVWDNTNNNWDNTSCKVSPSSTPTETVCECDNPPGHNFATTFYVPPNMIDFSSVFGKFDIVSNGAVFGTVIGVIVLYLLICIWAYRQDKKDIDKWALCYLADNVKSDKYVYLLRVYTGLSANAGTSSRISFILAGEKKDTGIRHLEDRSDMSFGVGSVRTFVMSVPEAMGDLTFINIWHDNSGKGNNASWYLNKIIVEDLQTKKRYIFLCNQWLSVDEDDGLIHRILSSSDAQDLHSFSLHFNEQARYNVTDSHLWLSVILRPEESFFTRVQRLSCCLAFLFLAMISNAMFFQASDNTDQVNLGPLTFTLSGFYASIISTLITAPPLILLTFMFKRSSARSSTKQAEFSLIPSRNQSEASIPHSTLKEERDKSKSLSDKDKPLILPFWCRYIAWCIVIIAVIIPGFFVILYSMEWGKEKSEEWLKCFFLSFFESLLLMDPIKVILLAAVLSFCLRNKEGDFVQYDSKHALDKDILLQETHKHASNVPRIVMEGKENGDGYQSPLDENKVKLLKSQRVKEMHAQRVFFELVLYMLFLCVLYMISFSNRDTQSFWLKNHLDQHLLRKITPTALETNITVDRFYKIKTGFDFYTWTNSSLVPFIFPKINYNGNKLIPDERLYLADQSSFRVGPLRLRQLRAPRERCMYPFLIDATCYDEYTIPGELTTDYCVGWTKTPCTASEQTVYKSFEAWKFTPAVDIWGMPLFGVSKYYGGGGYIADLGVNYEISKDIINELLTHSWIDRQTRAVFVEFTIYNSNVNLFTFVSLPVEFLETGGVLLSDFIQPFRSYQHVGNLGIVTFICEVIYLIAITIFAIKKFIQIYKTRCDFFQDKWQVFDLVIITLTFVCIGVYFARLILTNITMSKFSENKNKFVNFSHIAITDEILSSMIATLVFLSTLRLLRVLSYNKRLTELASVLTHAFKELVGCAVMFGIVYFAYVAAGYLFFGRYLHTYKDLLVAMTTISNALIGRNSINDLRETVPVIAEIYYFTFVLFVMWILMTMLNATLNKSINEIRQSSRQQAPPYGVYDMVVKIFSDVKYFIFGASEEEKKYPYGKDVIYVQEKTPIIP